MKKIYIQPNVSVSFVVIESLLQSASQGNIYKDQTGDGGGCSKKNEFTDDFFDDTPWPKSKSQWD